MEYIFQQEEFSNKDIEEKFPTFKKGTIAFVLHQMKLNYQIESIRKGKYRVIK